jgi:hypothetical protein
MRTAAEADVDLGLRIACKADVLGENKHRVSGGCTSSVKIIDQFHSAGDSSRVAVHKEESHPARPLPRPFASKVSKRIMTTCSRETV